MALKEEEVKEEKVGEIERRRRDTNGDDDEAKAAKETAKERKEKKVVRREGSGEKSRGERRKVGSEIGEKRR